MWKRRLEEMLSMLGDSPSKEQEENLMSWVSQNVPAYYLDEAMSMCSDCGDLYYRLSERDAEMGNWMHRK